MKKVSLWMCAVALVGCAAEPANKDGEVLSTEELELRTDRRADAASPFQGDLAWCEWSEGSLSARRPYHTWGFTMENDCDDALVDLASRAGNDTFLVLFRNDGRRWTNVGTNDDCTRGTLNSCLEGALPAGEYLAVASTYRYMRFGIPTAATYSLRVVCRDEASECVDPDAAPVACGARLGNTCADDEYCSFTPEAICGFADATGVCVERPDFFTRERLPVCGCDNVTYANPSVAAYNGVSVQYEGECRVEPEVQSCGSRGLAPCPEGQFCSYAPEALCGAADQTGVCAPQPGACTALYDPVCGCDDRTYGNACMAAQHGISVSYAGECRTAGRGEGEMCGGIAGFVCAGGLRCDMSGNDFCGADLAGVCVVDEPTACPAVYNPVCGCDGRTYSNDCYRRGAGVPLNHRGACR